MKKRWVLSVLLAGIVSVTAACGNGDEAGESSDGSDSVEQIAGEEATAPVSGEPAEMLEPDLTNIPDIVANVNGEEISKEDFEATYVNHFTQVAMQAQMSGQEVNQDELKTQIVESMVSDHLLRQEADRAGFDASEDEISQSLDELVTQYGLASQDEFLNALEEQGMDQQEVRSELAMFVKIEKLIDSKSDGIEPSEAELNEYYELIVAQLTQMGGEDVEIPEFDEVRSDIVEQVKIQKRSETAQELVEELREQGDVTIHL